MRLIVALFIASCLLPARAAAEPGVVRQAVAERLFQEGQAAMRAKKYELACHKLEASHELDPGGGTVLLLARCLETRGLTASAWTRYREAQSFALRDGRTDRAERARERIRYLEPRLARLFIRPRDQNVIVSLDGVDIPRSALAIGIPVDRGAHRLRARAAGRTAWQSRLAVPDDGRSFSIVIPALRRPPVQAPASSADQRSLGLALLGGGAAALVSATIASLVAVRRDGRADGFCPHLECTDRRGLDESRQARTAGNVATVSLVIGAVLGGSGAVLLGTAR